MVKKFLYISIFILAVHIPVSAQAIKAFASTDTSDYLIGDHITYTLEVIYDDSIKVYNPQILQTISKQQVDVIGEGEPKTYRDKNKKITQYTATITRYDSSEITIPAIDVFYRTAKDTLIERSPIFNEETNLVDDPTLHKVSSNPVTFMINSIKIAQNEDIKDVKAPKTIPLDWRVILLWILAGLLVIGAAVYLYLRYRKKKKGIIPEKKVIHLPPDVRALNDLNKLEEKQLWQKGKIKEYHSEITEIIRRYYEERFKLPALELTTSEVMSLLRLKKEIKDVIDVTYNFLTNADLVKFAKFQPMASVNQEMMEQAREIVRKTKAAQEVKEEETVDV